MFTKVLVVEDLDTVGYGISMMMKKELGIARVELTQYCDEAYLKLQKAQHDNQPFQLLITDLSFAQDHRPLQLDSGQALIEKIRDKDKDLPIIICTVEENPTMANQFIKANKISAYVLKGRDGLKDLKEAIQAVFSGHRFVSKKIAQQSNGQFAFEIEDYDVSLLLHLSHGLSQSQIARLFTNKGISPSSLSSIEKRLNRLKDVLKANNNVQLVANAKDLGLI